MSLRSAFIIALLVSVAPRVDAQTAREGEVRQIVTFSFLPGRAAEAINLYVTEALPLYDKNEAMLSFRGFREVESPVPLDLMVVSSFAGMAGMDASNAQLRQLASKAGTSIGALYGAISALSVSHTDQFVEMLPSLGTGDSSSKRLTAFLWYQIVPGESGTFERAIGAEIVPWEAARGQRSATGRFLVSDGWHYLRILAFDSLADYQSYWSEGAELRMALQMDRLVAQRRELIVGSLPRMSVR